MGGQSTKKTCHQDLGFFVVNITNCNRPTGRRSTELLFELFASELHLATRRCLPGLERSPITPHVVRKSTSKSSLGARDEAEGDRQEPVGSGACVSAACDDTTMDTDEEERREVINGSEGTTKSRLNG